ncbi:MAG: hypothetical protein ACPGXI_06030 [Mycobacterium sp.]
MINAVVEGQSDTGVADALIRAANREVGRIIVKGGKSKLDPLIVNFHAASAQGTWLVIRDSDAECPLILHARLTAGIINTHRSFLLRIAHPMAEGWLLADTAGFAGYFGVKLAQVPRDPESLTNAKDTVLRLCSSSRSRDIRRDMVVGSKTGPLYVHHVNEFAAKHWNVETAAQNSDSLRRALGRIRQLPLTGDTRG